MEKRKNQAARRVQPKLERLAGFPAADIESGESLTPADENTGAAE